MLVGGVPVGGMPVGIVPVGGVPFGCVLLGVVLVIGVPVGGVPGDGRVPLSRSLPLRCGKRQMRGNYHPAGNKGSDAMKSLF